MARPLTRAQALENRAFLKALRRTGNVRLACREGGAKYGTMQHRRRAHPGFAVRWDAALAFAQARLNGTGRVGASATGALTPLSSAESPSPSRGEGAGYRTLGGEPHLVRLKSGKLQ